MANEFIIRKGFQSQANSQITGSLIVTAGITGSFSGSVAAPGATTQVVYNSGGTLTADSGFVYSGSNIGIGTTSPAYKLDVSGSTRVNDTLTVKRSTASSLVEFRNQSDNLIVGAIQHDSSGGISVLGGSTYHNNGIVIGIGNIIAFSTNGTGEKMRIASSGNVGIGTTSPNAKLDVSGSVTITGSLNVTAGITGSLLGTASYASNALSSSYALTSTSASYALSASFAPTNTTGSFTGSFTGSLLGTASYANNALTASNSQNAQDILIYVKNVTGTQINKGKVVRISGATGDNALIATASYESDGVSANTLGITNQDIPNDSFGYVITEGTLITIDTSAFSAGQLLYLGATGSIIGTAPVAPLHAVRLGQVLRVQLNNGSMYVRIDNGYELGELHDVVDSTTTSSYGDLLVKSGSVWINSKQLTGSYELTGSLQATSFTGSLLGTASYASNALSSSYAATSSYVLNAVSASFASTASSLNTLNQNLTFNGNLTLNGTASITYLNVTYESASVIYSSGSNQLGDATNDTQTLIGRVKVSGSFETTGSLAVSSSQNSYFVGGSNVGINTTSPNAKLDVNGNSKFVAGFSSYTADGLFNTNALPGVYVSTPGGARGTYIGYRDFGSGQYWGRIGVSGSIAWSLGIGNSAGTSFSIGLNNDSALDYFTVSSGSGNVGIGTTTFVGSIKLAVNGQIGGPTYSGTYLDVTGAIPELRGNSGIAYYSAAGNHTFYGGSSVEYMRLTTAGLLGIGTTTPSTKLDISGSLNISGSGVQVPLQVYSGSTPLLFVSQSGNVGIGTALPNSTFQVSKGSATFQVTDTNKTANNTFSIYGLTQTSWAIATGNSGSFSGGEKIVLLDNGNVGIGTISPNSKLNVSGSVTITGSLNVSAGITGSLFGTASYASNALSSSYALSASYSLTATSASFASTASIATSSSYALSASFAPAGNPFPFSGSAQITGSLGVTGSVSLRSGSNLIVNNGFISASYGTSNVSVGGTPGWTSALRNTAFGISTQGSVTTQTDNTSVGYLSLLGGTQNTAVGVYASQLNTGTGNTVMGYYALGNQTSDTGYNVAVGYQSMFNASGSGAQYNVAVGYQALYTNRTGTHNVAIGANALASNTTGYRNIALNQNALNANTTGLGNIALGYSVMLNNISGQYNIALGHETLYSNSLGNYNIALGAESMLYMRTGSNNIAIGAGSMRGDLVQGINRASNIAIGQSALGNSVYGNSNTAIGTLALSNAANTTASATFNGGFNTALGSNAGRAIHTGIENITIGYRAGDVDNTYYNTQNSGSYNIFIGSLSGNTIGALSQSFDSYNVGIGYYTNYQLNNNGPYNVSLGDFTHSRLSSSAATRNTSIGSQAGRFITSGFRNTSLGAQAGYNITTGSYNILIGDSAGLTLNSGSNNTIIGSISAPTTSSAGLLIIGAGSTRRIYIDATGSGYISGSLAYTGSLLGTSSYASATDNIGDAISNNTDDYLLTATGGSTINGESNLTFGGSTLTLGGGAGITLSGGGNIDIGGGQLNGAAGSAVNVDTVNASVKNFDIKHPTPSLKDSHRLRYSSLEGPEISVYIRGRLTNNNTIELPHYWVDLVHENSITVNLTSIGNPQELYVTSANNKKVTIEIKEGNIDCYYTIYGERKDVNKLIVEYIKE
jgi:hypothetical protein